MGRNTWTMSDGTICSASDVVMTSVHSWEKFRACRDSTMEMFVDFFQSKPLLYDSLSSSEKTDLQNYRQALLDLPATVLAAVGDNFVLLNTEQYFYSYAKQPSWFADRHPRGRIHT